MYVKLCHGYFVYPNKYCLNSLRYLREVSVSYAGLTLSYLWGHGCIIQFARTSLVRSHVNSVWMFNANKTDNSWFIFKIVEILRKEKTGASLVITSLYGRAWRRCRHFYEINYDTQWDNLVITYNDGYTFGKLANFHLQRSCMFRCMYEKEHRCVKHDIFLMSAEMALISRRVLKTLGLRFSKTNYKLTTFYRNKNIKLTEM